MSFRYVSALVIMILCAGFTSSALAQINNGGFDFGTAPWKGMSDGVPEGCAKPFVATAGGNPGHCGEMGRTNSGRNGCQTSTIFQPFPCSSAPTKRCCVAFSASYPTTDELAAVTLVTPGGVATSRRIPAAGGWADYVICGPPNSCSGQALIAFSLLGPVTGTTTQLKIDNVFDSCLTPDATSASLIAIPQPTSNCPCDGSLSYENCTCGDSLLSVADRPGMTTWGVAAALALILLTQGILMRRAG